MTGLDSPGLTPFIIYAFLAGGLVAAIVIISWLLGPRHREQATGQPYESGMTPTGGARTRFSAGYYLIAVFFVIFDLEVVFLIAWALAARELGWTAYIAAMVFIAVLLLALIYLWREGALDWGTSARLRKLRVGAKR